MADLKWIKITTDMFDNRKLKHLRTLPNGNDMALIWVMLLTMAGRCNAGGAIYLTEGMPYTPRMLASELGFKERTVQQALTAFAGLNMIVMDEARLVIAGWEKYQNGEALQKIREQTRSRVAAHRERQKPDEAVTRADALVTHADALVTRADALHEADVTRADALHDANAEAFHEADVTHADALHVTHCNGEQALHVTQCNATEEELEEEKEEEREIEKEKDKEKERTNASAGAPAKPPRHQYGRYRNVLLSDEDAEKLRAEFPRDWEERVERLSEYMASKGAKYKNHLATIRAWARKEGQTNAEYGRRDKRADAAHERGVGWNKVL